jgi:hypothetical protein
MFGWINGFLEKLGEWDWVSIVERLAWLLLWKLIKRIAHMLGRR